MTFRYTGSVMDTAQYPRSSKNYGSAETVAKSSVISEEDEDSTSNKTDTKKWTEVPLTPEEPSVVAPTPSGSSRVGGGGSGRPSIANGKPAVGTPVITRNSPEAEEYLKQKHRSLSKNSKVYGELHKTYESMLLDDSDPYAAYSSKSPSLKRRHRRTCILLAALAVALATAGGVALAIYLSFTNEPPASPAVVAKTVQFYAAFIDRDKSLWNNDLFDVKSQAFKSLKQSYENKLNVGLKDDPTFHNVTASAEVTQFVPVTSQTNRRIRRQAPTIVDIYTQVYFTIRFSGSTSEITQVTIVIVEKSVIRILVTAAPDSITVRPDPFAPPAIESTSTTTTQFQTTAAATSLLTTTEQPRPEMPTTANRTPSPSAAPESPTTPPAQQQTTPAATAPVPADVTTTADDPSEATTASRATEESPATSALTTFAAETTAALELSTASQTTELHDVATTSEATPEPETSAAVHAITTAGLLVQTTTEPYESETSASPVQEETTLAHVEPATSATPAEPTSAAVAEESTTAASLQETTAVQEQATTAPGPEPQSTAESFGESTTGAATEQPQTSVNGPEVTSAEPAGAETTAAIVAGQTTSTTDRIEPEMTTAGKMAETTTFQQESTIENAAGLTTQANVEITTSAETAAANATDAASFTTTASLPAGGDTTADVISETSASIDRTTEADLFTTTASPTVAEEAMTAGVAIETTSHDLPETTASQLGDLEATTAGLAEQTIGETTSGVVGTTATSEPPDPTSAGVCQTETQTCYNRGTCLTPIAPETQEHCFCGAVQRRLSPDLKTVCNVLNGACEIDCKGFTFLQIPVTLEANNATKVVTSPNFDSNDTNYVTAAWQLTADHSLPTTGSIRVVFDQVTFPPFAGDQGSDCQMAADFIQFAYFVDGGARSNKRYCHGNQPEPGESVLLEASTNVVLAFQIRNGVGRFNATFQYLST